MFSAFVATRKKYMEKVNKSVRHGKQKQSEEKARVVDVRDLVHHGQGQEEHDDGVFIIF